MVDGAEEEREETPEQKAEAALRELGIAITSENPEHQKGGLTFYRVTGKAPGSDADDIEALGDNRLNALHSLLAASKAK